MKKKVAGIAVLLGVALFAAGFAGYLWSRKGLAGGGRTELAQWLPAVSSVATFVAAAFAAWFTAKTYQSQTRQEIQLLEERDNAAKATKAQARRAQAEQVVGWLTPPPPTVASRNPYVHVVNDSRLPVYEVTVRIWVDGGQIPGGLTLPQVNPGGLKAGFPSAVTQRYRTLVTTSVTDELESTGMTGVVKQKVRLTMHFRDAAGHLWIRDQSGLLKVVLAGNASGA